MFKRLMRISLLAFLFVPFASAQNPKRLDPYDIQYEPGVVLVKFEEKADVPLDKQGRLGKTALTGVQQVFSKYNIEQGERLFPQAKKGERLGKVRTFSGDAHEAGSLYNIFKMRFDTKHDAKVVAEELAKQQGVVYAEPDYYFYALEGAADGPIASNPSPLASGKGGKSAGIMSTVPNDPLYGNQWYLPAVKAPEAWDITTGDTTQIIAIIDTGVDWDHPDLDDNIWRNWDEVAGNGTDDDGNGKVDDIRGWDFVNNDNNPNDDNSHGTHVAGIAAAEGNNGVGVCGVAWNAKIMPVKMLQSSGYGSSSNLALGINYAANNGATVINMSLGSYGESITVKTALENAYSTAVLVAAAGNDGYKLDPPFPPWPPYFPSYPACYSFVIGVEATNQSGTRASFSNLDPSGPSVAGNNYGHNYEIKAPGVSMHSTFPNGNYSNLNGTSMASPVVAGAVALMKEYNPTQSTEQIFARLIQGANNGILDIDNSLDFVLVPDLHYVSYTLLDTLPGCDEDGVADAGETIEMYLTVKNAGGFADSVWSKLRLGQFEDPSVAIITDSTSQIGDISAYATLTGSSNPFLIEIDSDVTNNRDIVFEYEIGAANQSSFTGQLILNVQNGVELGGLIDSNMTLTSQYNYIVTQHLIVNSNDTLIIKPGTIIKIDNGKNISIWGTIIAEGKPDSLIEFIPRQENFGGFEIKNGRFKYCRIANIYKDGWGISATSGNIIFENCVFENNRASWSLFSVANFENVSIRKCNFINNPSELCQYQSQKLKLENSNIINNSCSYTAPVTIFSSPLNWLGNNILNNLPYDIEVTWYWSYAK